MTDTQMPEEMWASRRPQDVGDRFTISKCYDDQTRYTRSDIHAEAVALIEQLEGVLKTICKGSSYDLDWESDGKDYHVAIKGLQAVKKWRGE